MKQFTVYIKQHLEPITVMAVDRDDAECRTIRVGVNRLM